MIATKYAAFISYRHLTPDQEIAKKLHRLIESYSIPSALRKDGRRHAGKVFRDQEELPLSADLGRDIETALDNSDWLICICSPRYLESRWCQRELEYFIERNGRDHVLTVLAEGEPQDSFPELLLFETDGNGNRVEREPLAADVRGSSLAESLKKLKKEKYRILAPMAGTTFDGLYQRQRRRTMRNVLAAALATVAVLGGFLAYALVQNGKIEAANAALTEKNEQIERQNSELTGKNEQIEKQNSELSEKNEQIEKQNSELSKKNEQIAAQNISIEQERTAAARNECDLLVEKSVYYSSVNRKEDATRLGLEALDVSETLDGYARDSIREALAVSCSMGDFSVEAELDFPGFVNYDPDCRFSPDGTKLAVMDSRSGLSLCDAATGERLWVSSPFSHDITSVQWKEDSSLLAVTAKLGHTVCLVDAATGEHLNEIEIPWACNAIFDGDSLLVAFAQGIVRWDPAGSGENLPWVIQIDEDQQATSKSLLNDTCISLCQGVTFTSPRIWIKEKGSDGYHMMELESNQVINGYTLSPDGKWIFIHQYDHCMVMNMDTDEIRWRVDGLSADFTMEDCGPVWVGDVILDCGKAYDAQTGAERYTMNSKRCVCVTPDGQYYADATAIYRLSDGSWFADVPGTLKAMDPAGKHLVVFRALEYGRGVPGDSGAVIVRKQAAYLEMYPGNGSQYTVDQYEGSFLDIPDWSLTETEDGSMIILNDPYGSGTTGYLLSRNYVSPDTRFHIMTNLGGYIPIYDLQKSNEPAFRIYDFTVGDHVEAIDVSFSADSRYAAVAGAAGQVAVYELETGRMIRSFTDFYLSRSLSELKFNRSGAYLMVADFSLNSFRVYSVTNGQTVYSMHAVREVDSWGFDAETGDAVVKYADGSALIARMFEDEETLLSYARERIR